MGKFKNVLSEIRQISSTAATVAGVGVGTAKVVDSLSAVSEKPVAQQKKFAWLAGGSLVLLTTLIGGLIWVKNKAEAKKYRDEKLSDAEAKVIEKMAGAGGENKPKDVPDTSSDDTVAENEPTSEPRMTFIQWFKSKFQMPSLPSFLETIMSGVPAGYEEPMLLHLLCMLGAMCFSKLRAEYSDHEIHAANLQVIVEGNWGTGKAKFETMFKTLFERVIEYCRELMMNMDEESLDSKILQTTGIGTSMSKFVDILADNQGCHIYLFNSEVKALANDLKKGNGLNFDFLRKAFDNSDVCRNTKAKGGKNGIFPIFMNYTITGTPIDIRDSFKKELEGGTLSRIAWSCIPENGDVPAEMILPQGKTLEAMRDQIDEWRNQYCFREESVLGDVAVNTTIIDLDYVNEALREWNLKQARQSKAEKNPARKDARLRIATMAFHCAIVLHALCGFPKANDTNARKQVVDLTIFIANYCMERFLHKFGRDQNIQRQLNMEAEYVDTSSEMEVQEPQVQPRPESSVPKLITDIPTLKRMHDQKDVNGQNLYGWDKLSKLSGIPTTTLRRLIKTYEKELNQTVQ